MNRLGVASLAFSAGFITLWTPETEISMDRNISTGLKTVLI